MLHLKSDHIGYLADNDTKAVWRLDEVTTTTLVSTPSTVIFTITGPTAHGNGLRLARYGVSAAVASTGALYNPGTALGSLRFSGASAWFSSLGTATNAGCGAVAASQWSFGFWANIGSGTHAATETFFELSGGPTLGSVEQISSLGVYNCACVLFLEWDISTVAKQTLNTGIVLPFDSTFALAITSQPNVSSAAFRNVKVYLNGEERYSCSTAAVRTSGSGSSNYFVLGASARYGASTLTLSWLLGNTTLDDVWFSAKAYDEGKIRTIYGNGMRSWNESDLIKGGQQKVVARVKIEDGDGRLVDVTNLYGVNWLRSVTLREAVDDGHVKVNIKLQRHLGAAVSMSPFHQGSAINLNSADAYEPLIELRRRVIVELATVPQEWKIRGWEYAPAFEGLIDSYDWADDEVSIEALDDGLALEDTFRIDPREYDYTVNNTLSETHIQALLDDNLPKLWSGTAGASTVGYKGRYPRVALYTPEATSWYLRYDDQNSADVMQLTKAISDQIGFDLRYQLYEPWGEYRFTYAAPPRGYDLPTDLTRAVARADLNGGFFRWGTPHRLAVGQVFTVQSQGAGGFNWAQDHTVLEVVDPFEVATSVTGVAPTGAILTASCTFGAMRTVGGSDLLKLNTLAKDAKMIRNQCTVRYLREVGEPVTIGCTASRTADNVVTVTVDLDHDLTSVFKDGQGQQFNIDSGTLAGDYTAATFIGRTRIGASNVGGSVAAYSAIFECAPYSFKQVISTSTPSVQTYGLMPTAIYEGSNGNISTESEARTLTRRVVSDLAEPTAEVGAEIKCDPFIQLHDYLGFSADKKGRWTGTLATAVTERALEVKEGKCTTKLRLRGSAPTLGVTWVNRIRVGALRPGKPVRNLMTTLAVTSAATAQTRKSGTIEVAWPKLVGPLARKLDRAEVHLSTAATFKLVNKATTLATPQTLVTSVRGNQAAIATDGTGRLLDYRKTYYPAIRYVTIDDTYSEPLYLAPIQTRVKDKADAVVASFDGLSGYFYTSTFFNSNDWVIYRLRADQTTYSGLWFNHVASQTTTAFLMPVNGAGGGPTESYFIAPKSGVVRFSGELPLYNASSITIPMALGIFDATSSVSYPMVPILTTGALGSATIILTPLQRYGDNWNSTTPTVRDRTDFLEAWFETTVSVTSGNKYLIGVKGQGGGLDAFYIDGYSTNGYRAIPRLRISYLDSDD